MAVENSHFHLPRVYSKNDQKTIQSNVTNKRKYEAFLNMLPRKGKIAEAVIKELQKKNIISAT